MLFTLRNLKNLIKMRERNLMPGVMNLNTLKTIAKVILSNLFQIFLVIIVMDMDIMQQILRNVYFIVVMQIVECLATLTMQEIEEDPIEMKVEKEEKLFVTDVTILDTLQRISEHLMTKLMNKERMYLYVSYVITLETQKSSAEQIEEILKGIRIIEGTIEEMMTV